MFPRAAGKRSFNSFVLGHETAYDHALYLFWDSTRIIHLCLVFVVHFAFIRSTLFLHSLASHIVGLAVS